MDKLSYQQGKQDAIVFIKRCDAVRSTAKIQRANLNKAKCPKGKHWVQPSNRKRGFCRSGGDGSASLEHERLSPQQISYMKGGDIDSTDYSPFERDYLNEIGYLEKVKEEGISRKKLHEGWEEEIRDIGGDDSLFEKINKMPPAQRELLPKTAKESYVKRVEKEKRFKAYQNSPEGKRKHNRNIAIGLGLMATPLIIGGIAMANAQASVPTKKDSYKQGRLDGIASLNIRLDDGYIPPESVRREAKKGLEARRKASKSNKGGLSVQQANNEGVGSGVQRAVNLVNSDRISLDTIKKMRSFFARHRNNYEKAKSKGLKPEESKAIQAWLLWGGDAGERWAIEVLSSAS